MVLLKDIHRNPIKVGQKFKFKFLKDLDNHIDLVGSFSFNEEYLCYEIDIEKLNTQNVK